MTRKKNGVSCHAKEYGYNTNAQHMKIFERRYYVDEEGVYFHSFGADVNSFFFCIGRLPICTRKETG